MATASRMADGFIYSCNLKARLDPCSVVIAVESLYLTVVLALSGFSATSDWEMMGSKKGAHLGCSVVPMPTIEHCIREEIEISFLSPPSPAGMECKP